MKHKQIENQNDQNLTPELQHIQTWLTKTKFKKTMFGGVKESDVWKKINELNTLYDQALTAERIRYDTLLKQDHDRIQKAAEDYCRKYQENMKTGGNGGTQ